MIFADRIELVSPEQLHDVLDIENIRFSLSNRRNLTLTSCAVHILTYLGSGTGIPRASDAWQMITLDNARQGNPLGAYSAGRSKRDSFSPKQGPSQG
ncbi:ATP-dependent DNA helicase [Pseudomonas syringae pv. philadelphi]|uniref:ATP-dependent DNA helicase n=1 Tax=Pseudomonas syringae pv. philadelphi TaxID=251706 RepID=A0A3M3YXC9_9PSED|nr:ATP-dependent DNA helicase [Pseudomonas syringae pv. philadelphi]